MSEVLVANEELDRKIQKLEFDLLEALMEMYPDKLDAIMKDSYLKIAAEEYPDFSAEGLRRLAISHMMDNCNDSREVLYDHINELVSV